MVEAQQSSKLRGRLKPVIVLRDHQPIAAVIAKWAADAWLLAPNETLQNLVLSLG